MNNSSTFQELLKKKKKRSCPGSLRRWASSCWELPAARAPGGILLSSVHPTAQPHRDHSFQPPFSPPFLPHAVHST